MMRNSNFTIFAFRISTIFFSHLTQVLIIVSVLLYSFKFSLRLSLYGILYIYIYIIFFGTCHSVSILALWYLVYLEDLRFSSIPVIMNLHSEMFP